MFRDFKIRMNYIVNSRLLNFIFKITKTSKIQNILVLLLLWPIIFFRTVAAIFGYVGITDECTKYQNKSGDLIYLFRSDMPEKDHYGEAVLDVPKRDYIVNEVLKVIPNNGKICVLLNTGDKFKWYTELSQHISNAFAKDVHFFVLSAWRIMQINSFGGIKAGAYLAGSNFTSNNTPVFSEHCIGIGALEHELWYINDKK